MKRLPAVAGQFYPGDMASLAREVERLIPDYPPEKKRRGLAVVSPHAGYVYSGAVAGETFARVNVPEDVIILGPNHHGRGEAVALAASGVWHMPMGDVPINDELSVLLAEKTELIKIDDLAHRFEHSLEVQVPFLQFVQKRLRIAPLVISYISYEDCVAVGKAVAGAVKDYGRPVLVVASTDMTHYESREAAAAKDLLALGRVEALDPEGLYSTVVQNKISMCGIMPTTIALVAAIELGAGRAEVVRYTDSGEVSGDTRQVVGYAGVIIS